MSVIDRAFLAGFTGGDAELEKDLISFFVDNARTYIDDLAASASGEPWRATSHKLKGAARSVGAIDVAALALQSETLDASDDEKRAQMVAALKDAVEKVAKSL